MVVVAPFRIKVMIGILQRTIEKLLADLRTPPFLDNIAIASATEELYQIGQKSVQMVDL
jgi:hypothetical protein